MPRRKLKYPDRPRQPDPVKWAKLLEKGLSKHPPPDEPKGGRQLWRWDTLEDVEQKENSHK